MNLVNAQQARRILDRMVGYKISPLLWAKVKRGLSAGRVQSVALRIICDREEEINAFIPEEYWTLDAELKIAGEKKPLLAKFYGDSESKMNISSREEMDRVMAEISKETFKVIEVKKGERVKKAPLPFTTSTLQQEASKALNFPISKTMRIAQQLYEGVDVKQMHRHMSTSEKITVKIILQHRQLPKSPAQRSRMHMRPSVHPISIVHRQWSKIPFPEISFACIS